MAQFILFRSNVPEVYQTAKTKKYQFVVFSLLCLFSVVSLKFPFLGPLARNMRRFGPKERDKKCLITLTLVMYTIYGKLIASVQLAHVSRDEQEHRNLATKERNTAGSKPVFRQY